MLERDLEERSKEKIERVAGEALKLVLLRLMGWPDRTCLLPGGHIFFVEFKRAITGRVSAQQKFWRKRLIELGFRIYTIDTDEDFDRALATEISLAQIPGSVDRASVQPQQRARSTTRRRG